MQIDLSESKLVLELPRPGGHVLIDALMRMSQQQWDLCYVLFNSIFDSPRDSCCFPFRWIAFVYARASSSQRVRVVMTIDKSSQQLSGTQENLIDGVKNSRRK